MLRQCCTTLTVATRGRELIEITAEVELWIAAQSMREGVLTLFVRHTSASVCWRQGGSRSAPGRGSISTSTARAATAVKWRCS